MVDKIPVRKEIVGIDIIRFLCAISVMFSHLLPPISMSYEWASYGGAGVDIFFVISGFIIPQSSEGRSPFSFIQSRIVRLVPAVWICATIGLIFLVISDNFSHDLLGRYLRSIFFVPVVPGKIADLNDMWIDGVYWTLFVEIAFYFLVLCFLFANTFRRIGVLATVLGSVSLAYWGSLFFAQIFFPSAPFSKTLLDTEFKRYLDLSLVHQGAWFGLGINIWLLTKTSFVQRLPSVLICLTGGILHHAIYHLKSSPLSGTLYDLIGVSLILLSVFSSVGRGYSEKVRKICRWIGLTTYPLYLVHDNLGSILIKIVSDTHIMDRELATFCVIPFIVVFAFAIAYFAEPPLQACFRMVLDRIKLSLQHKHSVSSLFKKTNVYTKGLSVGKQNAKFG